MYSSPLQVVSTEHDVHRAQFQLHARFRTEVLARAAHRSQPSGFTAVHGNLKYSTTRGLEIIQLFLGFSQKSSPEQLDGLADVIGSQL